MSGKPEPIGATAEQIATVLTQDLYAGKASEVVGTSAVIVHLAARFSGAGRADDECDLTVWAEFVPGTHTCRSVGHGNSSQRPRRSCLASCR
ncbi:hypothetical protein JJL56_01590 [Azospirillum sp. YIM DDC1]|uniref:Uncharacterized protein n=1 Tax=Azospirillum aestuarii TaxID=2802052 RepID=A0ABS1HS35_9PROT|nr:hypothetical protein [Azospirillum aestuarii]